MVCTVLLTGKPWNMVEKPLFNDFHNKLRRVGYTRVSYISLFYRYRQRH